MSIVTTVEVLSSTVVEMLTNTVTSTEINVNTVVQSQAFTLTTISTGFTVLEGGGGGVSDHGALTGLADDDHTQYHNNARGDARYYTKSQSDSLLGTPKPDSSGLISGGDVTINADPTKINISAGSGWVLDWTDPVNPVGTLVTWGAITGVAIPNLAGLLTTVGVDATGAAVFLTGGAPTAQARRDRIQLSIAVHTNGTSVVAIIPIKKLAYQNVEAIIDYLRVAGSATTGNQVYALGALTIEKTAGTTATPFINSSVDAQNPYVKTDAAQSPASYFLSYRNGSGGYITAGAATNVNPNVYDTNAGTPTTVSNNKFTCQYFYWISTSAALMCVLGNVEYGTLDEAVSGHEEDRPTIDPVILAGGVPITVLAVKKSVTDLTITTTARFLHQTEGLSGGVTTLQTLQATYNVSTPNPEIITDSTRGAITIRCGSASNSDNVAEWQNLAGTTTASVNGDGEFVGTVFNGVALTDAGLSTKVLCEDGVYRAATGGGNSVTATVSFGATFTDSASTVVTGQSWVASGSEITAHVLCGAGVDPLEIAILDFKIMISDLVAGVGFTVTLYSMPQARGDYSVMCIGV